MIGAGVFSAFAPAAAAAGTGLLIGLALAAGVAYCNATASAQLAARYPTSGGTYVYGRERLGAWWGFTAGWGFVIGKTASCAAMALTFAAYAIPGPIWVQRAVAVLAVLALTTINLRGITRTARLARILVAGSLLALGIAVLVILTSGRADPGNLALGAAPGGAYGILQSAGLLFFAFAGYARIATLGEEVREPERTIPRAIPIALGITVAVYLVVGASVLAGAGPAAMRGGIDPVATRRRGRRRDVGAADRPRRRDRRQSRGAAGPHRRHRPDHPGDGPRGRSAAPLAAIDRATPCPTTRRSRSPWRWSSWSLHHRPARRHRLLLIRCPDLLRDRQRGGVHPAPIGAPLAARAQRRSGCWAASRWSRRCPWVRARRRRHVCGGTGGPVCRRPPARRLGLRPARAEVRPPGRTRAGGASWTSSPGRRASGGAAGRGGGSSRRPTGRS